MHYLSEILSWLRYSMKSNEGWRMNQSKQPDARISVDSDPDMHLAYCSHCDWRYLTDNKKGAWQLGSEHLFMAHGLRGRENHAYNALEAIKRRAKIDSSCFNLTTPLGSALQQPAAAGQPAANEADLPEARLKSYPQIYAHVDN
jgi:hypothetical protein